MTNLRRNSTPKLRPKTCTNPNTQNNKNNNYLNNWGLQWHKEIVSITSPRGSGSFSKPKKEQKAILWTFIVSGEQHSMRLLFSKPNLKPSLQIDNKFINFSFAKENMKCLKQGEYVHFKKTNIAFFCVAFHKHTYIIKKNVYKKGNHWRFLIKLWNTTFCIRIPKTSVSNLNSDKDYELFIDGISFKTLQLHAKRNSL